jgi:chitin disaccharide deacetylase
MRRYLVVNADDFGLSQGVNRGILEAVEKGIVTSASLMVRQPAAAEAGEYARRLHQGRSGPISVGLHLDLGEWIYRGEWVPLYSVVDRNDTAAVEAEIASQLEKFRALAGRHPTHLDSHQHVHRNEPVRSIMIRLARELEIPLRELSPGIHYCGDFYGQGGEGESFPELLTVANLENIMRSLEPGTTELGCHPGYDDGLATMYRAERASEVKVLCDPSIPELLKELGIELRSFATLPDDAHSEPMNLETRTR